MDDDKTILEIARRAIADGRKEDAQSLLKPLMKRDVAEAFVLASNVAKSQEHALKLLQHALGLDPDNTRIKEHLLSLARLYRKQNIKTVGELVSDSPTLTDEMVNETVELFKKYGWELVGQRKGYAQFMRKPKLSNSTSLIVGFAFSIIGILIILAYMFSSKDHVFIEADGNAIKLSHEKDDIIIDYPEQSLIWLEKHRSISLGRGILLSLIGAMLSSPLFILITMNLIRILSPDSLLLAF